jgi:ectoine hydroxylase-related dioxygenase (phytanoyl-CoA dioxygenase family)
MRNLLATVPAVQSLAQAQPIRALVATVLGPAAFAVRGLLFDKTRAANWKVPWHQDLTIAVRRRLEVAGFGPWSVKAGVQHVQPPEAILESMLTVRLHLDDCGPENGPLQVFGGSHLSGRMSADVIRAWRERMSPIRCVVGRGGVLLMRPLLLHSSLPARAPAHRRIIHLDFAAYPLPGGLEWLGDSSTQGRSAQLE